MQKQIVIIFLLLAILITSALVTVAVKLPATLEALNNRNKEINITEVVNDIKINTNSKDVNYMYGTATAYTPSAGGINSDDNPEFTSTMNPAKEGVIAVNPQRIPYGSEVMIIVDGTVIRGQALDTGGAMRNNPKQVDILMEDVKEAKNWGRKKAHIIWW